MGGGDVLFAMLPRGKRSCGGETSSAPSCVRTPGGAVAKALYSSRDADTPSGAS